MILQQILLRIFAQLNNERTISAAFHLLRGKRSGQTIQDVGIFKLHEYFSLLPKLSREKFDKEVNMLLQYNYLTIDDNGYYSMTASGLKKSEIGVECSFYSWDYRGNEHIFFARLSLIVQALSYQASRKKQFIPIQRNEEIQHFAKQFLIAEHYQSGHLQNKLFQEIIESLEKLAITNKQKELLVNRLTGMNIPGLTWQQLAFNEKMSEMDVQLNYISALHNWLREIPNYPYLAKIAENIRVKIPLTGSAFQTAQLFKQGYTIDQIVVRRGLKQSTIEDHLVELAMNERLFPIYDFISIDDQKKVLAAIEDYNTKKLKVLHEIVPHLTYFQIRLVLAKGVE
ncbi:helix-turn-helix domain-containing protein [Solibacillus sp. CAU 1738]|uniref:helix-turn-helix domain-containing protein n=1 Tax=Solibacillus sp. CAU 1738 TaxID=3140363 RepID=UPI003260EEC6